MHQKFSLMMSYHHLADYSIITERPNYSNSMLYKCRRKFYQSNVLSMLLNLVAVCGGILDFRVVSIRIEFSLILLSIAGECGVAGDGVR